MPDRQPRSYARLVILTTLVILPDDYVSREIAKYRADFSSRIVDLGGAVQNIRKEVVAIEDWIRRLPADHPDRDHPYKDLTFNLNMIEVLRVELDRAELRGPPFAAAVWRVGAVRKK